MSKQREQRSGGKSASLRGLDALNFCNAGIQTGLGPFIAIFYGGVRHWNPSQIGLLLALQSLSGIATQAFVGNVFDESRHKRLLTAVAAITVSAGALGIALSPSFPVQAVTQLVIGFGITVFPAATAAFALGLTGKDGLSKRVARNEMFTHSGNVTFAIIAGAVGTALALSGIFYAAALFAAGMAGAVVFIRDRDVSYEAARGGKEDGPHEEPNGATGGPERRSLRDLFGDRRVRYFTAAVVLFTAANSATLPLVGQIFAGADRGPKNASWETALAVMVAEVVMVFVAAFVGKKAEPWGRKAMFVAAFGLLAVRNALGLVSHAHAYLIGLQAIDGAAAAIFGVLLTLVTADLAKGSGRFNLLQGSVQSAMALGGFLSNLGFGFIARRLGFDASFIGLSVVAVGGGLLYLLRMPETKQAADQREAGGAAGELRDRASSPS